MPGFADFIHLRVHSAFSLSEGAIRLDDLAARCKAQKMPAVAVTDTNNLFGALEFVEYAAKSGVQPIIGCQLSLAREDQQARPNQIQEFDSIVLLVQNETGYQNLLLLLDKAYDAVTRQQSPHVSLADLENHHAGLICLTGGTGGPIGRLLLAGQKEKAESTLLRLRAAFGDRLYIELQRHGLSDESRIEETLLDFAYAHNIPLVAVNQCFYPAPDDYEAHDALLCIAQGKTVGDPARRKVTPQHYFKSAAEMRHLFADLPEACDNTLVIAKRCSFLLKGKKPMLPNYRDDSGDDEATILRRQAREGLERRLLNSSPAKGEAEYRDRLEYEIDMIIKMGFAGYFLIVADFIRWAKSQGIPVGPGRGSGAGSVAAWALTITDLDPLRWGLLFERFLNPERVSMPDFDIDFCQDRRDEVIRYVQQKYGAGKVAQIITFGKLQARAVVRDVGRVLAMAYGHVDKICKLIPNNPAAPVTLQQAIDGEPLLQAMRKDDAQVAELMEIALRLEGLYRHASTHAAGVVIGDRPLNQLIPMYRDPRSDWPVTQFNMKYVEKAGLVKFDFLGLKTLTVLVKAVELLAQQGIKVDLDHLPLDDPKTYALLASGETSGVFQLESSGMRDVLRRMKPDRFEDIIAVVALYRPGPMDNIPKYISCKLGQEPADYLHPTLEPILRETYGIMIYQEQVMQIAQVLSGYSLGGADLLRRAMGKKIQSEMDAQREAFVKGAKETHNVPPEKAAHIFDLVDKFAGYGFNKSHAAAYALIAYQTAYLKANYPAPFMAALMTLDMGDTDKLSEFREELKRIKIPLLPPDINKSHAAFAVEDGAVRYALAALKGVGLAAMQELVKQRELGGAFKNLSDFIKRLDAKVVNKRQLESLIAAGAMECLHPDRAQLFGNVEKLVREAQLSRHEAETQQSNFFGGEVASQIKLDAAPGWNILERLQREFSAIGFYFSAHPLDSYTGLLRRLHVITAEEMQQKHIDGKLSGRVQLAGVMLSKKERKSAKGNKYAFVEFADATGSFELTFFSEILSASRDLLEGGKPLLLSADVQRDENGFRLTAQSVKSLDTVAQQQAGQVNILVQDMDALPVLSQKLNAAKMNGANKPPRLFLQLDEAEIEIELTGAPTVSGALLAEIKQIAGLKVEEV